MQHFLFCFFTTWTRSQILEHYLVYDGQNNNQANGCLHTILSLSQSKPGANVTYNSVPHLTSVMLIAACVVSSGVTQVETRSELQRCSLRHNIGFLFIF